MKFVVALALIGSISSCENHPDSDSKVDAHLTGEALTEYLNKAQDLFKAEVPNKSYINALMDVKYTRLPEDAVFKPYTPLDADLPSEFDARAQWPACSSIGEIRDQANCGSCWAFGAVEAMSDRVCIASKQALAPTLSAEDLLSCCGQLCGSGCLGGYPFRAWEYMQAKGICTGGGFYEHLGCKPYSIEPCGTHVVNGTIHHHDCLDMAKTPRCSSQCTNADYPEKYINDKHYGKSAYAIKQSVEAIKQEIFENGPVEATFRVYEDFMHYKEGIYKHVAGGLLGGHAVKMIGWGVENGTDYWLLANSWDVVFGEKGFFRMLQGVNECAIEEGIVAGLPNV